MAQKILIRRGTEAQRLLIGTPPAVGELLYTTDYKELWVGDGATATGVALNYIKSDGHGVDQTLTGNLGITGNLTVTGNVTQTTSNNVVIGDSIIILNADSADIPVNDAGFEVERGLQTNTSVLWDEGELAWLLTDTVSSRRILDAADILTAGNGISIIAGEVANTDLGSSQLFYRTVTGDSGTTSASANEDSFAIIGAGSVSTAVTADTITITGTTYAAGDFLHDSLDFTGSTKYHIADAGTNDGKVLTASAVAGTFTWESAGAATNDTTITLAGSGAITGGGDFTTNQAGIETITFSHSSADGDLHVPATSTTNNGKVLTAGATAGSLSWVTPVDLSTDVTLAAVTSNYLSIAGQVITAGVVPISLGGTGATTAALARTALDVDQAGTDNSTNVTLGGTGSYITIAGQVITVDAIDMADTNLVAGTGITLTTNTLSVDYGTTSTTALRGDSGFEALSNTPATINAAVANDINISKLVAVNAAGTALVYVDTIDGGTF